MKVVGLQTFKWQNNFKSVILLILFPVLLCFVGILIMFAINLISSGYDSTGSSERSSRNQQYPPATTAVATVDPVTQTINSIPYVAPFFLLGTALWFLIAWVGNRSMITSFTHAQPLDRKSNPRIYNIVENLCISRGLPTPQIYIIEEPSMNAFASGLSPKDAFICFTRGLVDKLNDQELEAVAAHELTHVMNYDIRLMLVAIVFVGIIQTLAWAFMYTRVRGSGGRKGNDAALLYFVIQIVVFIIAFIFSAIVQASISQKREFLADAGSVELTKTSQPLISALLKISQDPHVQAVGNANVAQMFIENPLQANEGGFFARLFATHPPISERIKALQLIDAGSTATVM